MKSSQILKKARKLIESGEEKYICFAVSLITTGTDDCYRIDRHPIIDYISEALFPCGTVVSWQCRNLSDFNWERNFQKDRLAWIDWMIVAYEEKGD